MHNKVYVLDTAELGDVQGGEKEPEYLVSEHGKPYFEDGRICFNLSHSGTLAVCAVSDREVGADVQQYRHFEDNLIRFVFQPGEMQRIYACETPEQRDILCTRLWTVKESIMKYLGTGIGLRYDLDFFVIRVDWGLGLHLPYNTGSGGYFNIPSFNKGQCLNLAIGYPF